MISAALSLTLPLHEKIFFLFAQLLVKIAQLLQPGGVRAIVAENLLLKQQLLVACRSRQRAPRLSALDRFLFGWWSLFLSAPYHKWCPG